MQFLVQTPKITKNFCRYLAPASQPNHSWPKIQDHEGRLADRHGGIAPEVGNLANVHADMVAQPIGVERASAQQLDRSERLHLTMVGP